VTGPLFAYDPTVVARFPLIVGGVLHVEDVANGPSSPALREAFTAEQATVLARLGAAPLSEVASLAAWRRAFRAFGVDPTAYRSAAEALLRRLTKQGSIPSIDTLVDIGNLVAIRHALPVAVFDLDAIAGGLTVRLATGDESFTDLGSGAVERPDAGEVIFADEAGHVAARRWCWRQSAESASSATTSRVLVTVEGHHEAAREDVEAAVGDLEALLREHAGAPRIETAVLDGRRAAYVGPRP
jgi:DNA/RNA-binding domain of Phe-tRNA-synthetase-like protein